MAPLMCKSFVVLRYRVERLNDPFSSLFLPKFPSGELELNSFTGKANTWRNQEHAVFDLFSNLKCVRFFRFIGEPQEHVKTPRG